MMRNLNKCNSHPVSAPVILISLIFFATLMLSNLAKASELPVAPTNLKAHADSTTSVTLTWKASSNGTIYHKYMVYRDNSLIASLGSVLSYSDTELTADRIYSYTVSACDIWNDCSDKSASATVQTPNPNSSMSVSASTSGPITAQTIMGMLTVDSNDMGKLGSVFVAAILPNNLGGGAYFLNSSLEWKQFTSCDKAPAYLTTTLSTHDKISIIATPTDLSESVGIEIFIGYGLGSVLSPSGSTCTNMLNNGTYNLAHTIE
ncbi:MAG: fibronectin type III domain-containing protein [Nitrosomonas sp.]